MNTPSRQIIAGEIRAAMARAGVNQSGLADRISMSRPALSTRLAGKRAFNTDHVFEIAEALGVEPLSLMRGPAERAS